MIRRVFGCRDGERKVEADSAGRAKTELRGRMAAVRDALPDAERARRSERLCRGVEREILSPLRQRLGRGLTVFLYAAFRSEADPLPLARMCWAAGDRVAAPRVAGQELEWRVVRSPDDWRPGKWGIPEPDPGRTEPVAGTLPPDAVLVPGLAFDPRGGRLGYGGGYYDRLFASVRSRGEEGGQTLWIGFAFEPQVTPERLPGEPHDLALDALATDERILWWSGEVGT